MIEFEKGNSRLDCAKIIEKLSKEYPNLIHLTTDGDDYTHIEYGRHFDVGIAEQNLINISIGLGLRGHKVILNGISSFILGNAYIQLKNLCYHNVDVTIMGIGSGISYSKLGFSHQTPYDLGLLSTLPNMKIFIPSDTLEAQMALEESIRIKGPSFIRIRTGFEPINYKNKEINFTKVNLYLNNNSENLIISNGGLLNSCVNIAKDLKLDLINLNSFNLFDIAELIETIKNYKNIFVFEEHYYQNGLGTQILCELNKLKIKGINYYNFGLSKEFISYCGTSDFILENNGLSEKNIKIKIQEVL